MDPTMPTSKRRCWTLLLRENKKRKGGSKLVDHQMVDEASLEWYTPASKQPRLGHDTFSFSFVCLGCTLETLPRAEIEISHRHPVLLLAVTFRHLRPTICQRDVSKDLVHGDTISFRTRTIPVQEQKRVLCWPISGCVPPAWPRGCFCAGLVFILHLKQNCFPGFWSKPVYTHSLTFGHAKRRMSKPYVAFKLSCVVNSRVNMASNGVLLRHAVHELPLHLHVLLHLVYPSTSTSTTIYYLHRYYCAVRFSPKS